MCWIFPASSSLYRARWKSIYFTIFASSTCITWSYLSIIGGIIRGEHSWKAKFFIISLCSPIFVVESLCLHVFRSQCVYTPPCTCRMSPMHVYLFHFCEFFQTSNVLVCIFLCSFWLLCLYIFLYFHSSCIYASQCVGGCTGSIISRDSGLFTVRLGVRVAVCFSCFLLWVYFFHFPLRFFPFVCFLFSHRIASTRDRIWILRQARWSPREVVLLSKLGYLFNPSLMWILHFLYSMIPWWKICSFQRKSQVKSWCLHF